MNILKLSLKEIGKKKRSIIRFGDCWHIRIGKKETNTYIRQSKAACSDCKGNCLWC